MQHILQSSLIEIQRRGKGFFLYFTNIKLNNWKRFIDAIKEVRVQKQAIATIAKQKFSMKHHSQIHRVKR